MESGFQKLTWLPNDRSLVGYLASHRLFDITWLLLIPMLTYFQIFGSHCPTRSDFYIFLLGPYPAWSRNWYFFYNLRPVRTYKIFYGPRSLFSRSGPWISDFKCTWRFWYSWLFPTGLVLRNRIWIRIDHHNKLDKLGKGGSKIYFWIKLIFDQIKKASEWKINFTEKIPDFIFWKSKTPEHRTR